MVLPSIEVEFYMVSRLANNHFRKFVNVYKIKEKISTFLNSNINVITLCIHLLFNTVSYLIISRQTPETERSSTS